MRTILVIDDDEVDRIKHEIRVGVEEAIRREPDKVTAEIDAITHDPWLRRVLTCTLTGDTPAAHRLTIAVDTAARDALEEEVFGKRVLITNREDWSVADVVAAYRSQSEAEFSFRQLKDPHVVSFSPMHHWTEHNIRVHTFTCVLARQLAPSCAARPPT